MFSPSSVGSAPFFLVLKSKSLESSWFLSHYCLSPPTASPVCSPLKYTQNLTSFTSFPTSTLVPAIFLHPLDYSNSLLFGLPASALAFLQTALTQQPEGSYSNISEILSLLCSGTRAPCPSAIAPRHPEKKQTSAKPSGLLALAHSWPASLISYLPALPTLSSVPSLMPHRALSLLVSPAWTALAVDAHKAHPLFPSGPCSDDVNRRGLPCPLHKGKTPSLVLLYSPTLYFALFFFIVHISFRPIYIFVIIYYLSLSPY